MCYTTALDRSYAALQQDYNRKLSYRSPIEILENDDRSILPIRRIVAFARPFWPIITTAEPDEFSIGRWGFLPTRTRTEQQANEFLKKYPTYNTISEDVETKRTYKSAFENGNRCLIPVTEFFEWQDQGKKKTPFKIRIDRDGAFSLAGIWEESALGYRTYSVLTTAANPLMARIHNSKKRMPVIIPKELEETWVRAELSVAETKALCTAFPEQHMLAEEMSS